MKLLISLSRTERSLFLVSRGWSSERMKLRVTDRNHLEETRIESRHLFSNPPYGIAPCHGPIFEDGEDSSNGISTLVSTSPWEIFLECSWSILKVLDCAWKKERRRWEGEKERESGEKNVVQRTSSKKRGSTRAPFFFIYSTHGVFLLATSWCRGLRVMR